MKDHLHRNLQKMFGATIKSFVLSAIVSVVPWTVVQDKTVGCKVGSILAALVVCILNVSHQPRQALAAFLGHIVADWCILDSNENKYGSFHHAVSAFMASYTLYSWHQIPLVTEGTYLLLLMEISTPVLHLGWILRHYGEYGFAIVCGAVTTMLFIIRIIIPICIIKMILECSSCDPMYSQTMIVAVAGLGGLQLYWFQKLCGIVFCAFRDHIPMEGDE